MHTGSRARKSSAGYDLTRLFVGGEGTLGIVTEAILRVQPTPEAVSAAVCAFATIDDAVRCVIETIQTAVPVARIELLDPVQMDAINRRSGLSYAAVPTLFLEFHGGEGEVGLQARRFGEIAAEHGASGFRWTADEGERRALWEARHHAYESALALRPGAKGITTDVCVPVSELAACIAATRADIDAAGLLAPMVGHVGDGNFHVVMLVDPDDPAELATADAVYDRLVERAIACGGTCTGEHGVGYGKARFLAREHGDDAVELMRAIKHALDPDGILNPGKVLPESPDAAT